MFPFRNKKSAEAVSSEEKSQKIKAEIDAELKKEKLREKEKGPSWMPIWILLISVFMGGVFWVYGKLSNGGLVNIAPINISLPSQNSEPVDFSTDGVIIFE